MAKEDTLTNAALAEIDERQVGLGLPILSAIVRHDDGGPISVTLESIKRFNLALPGETQDETVKRLEQEAFAYYRKAN